MGGGKDVVAHIKAALASSSVAVDEEVSEYVSDIANEMLQDGDEGRGAEEMVEELVDAAGPMLGEFIDDDAIKALFQGAVAHFMGSDSDGGGGDGDGGGDGGGAAAAGGKGKPEYCLNLEGIILAFAGKVLLRPTSLKLEKGHRYGVVGQNGAGKTTLLTRLSAGDINGFPPGLRCVFVQHEVLVTLTDSILDFLTSQASSLGAAEADVKPCLEAVGFTRELMGKTVAELSGGWRMRLAIARAMLQKADLLLLDEPTNHLDVGAVEWLANHLNGLKHTTVLVVSHDYDFLTDVATDIVHFEDQALTTFGGGFPGFRKERPNLVRRKALSITHSRIHAFTHSRHTRIKPPPPPSSLVCSVVVQGLLFHPSLITCCSVLKKKKQKVLLRTIRTTVESPNFIINNNFKENAKKRE